MLQEEEQASTDREGGLLLVGVGTRLPLPGLFEDYLDWTLKVEVGLFVFYHI